MMPTVFTMYSNRHIAMIKRIKRWIAPVPGDNKEGDICKSETSATPPLQSSHAKTEKNKTNVSPFANPRTFRVSLTSFWSVFFLFFKCTVFVLEISLRPGNPVHITQELIRVWL